MKISPIEAIAQPVPPNLKALVQRVHKAKGRHHTQIAMCDLFDACALPNVRPGAEMAQTLPPASELEQQNRQLREQNTRLDKLCAEYEAIITALSQEIS